MDSRKLFNPHSFLMQRVPLSAFRFDMLQGYNQYYSGGYFPENASPFSLFKSEMRYAHYLRNLSTFINGMSEVICFDLLVGDDDFCYEKGLLKPAWDDTDTPEDHEAFARKLKENEQIKLLSAERLRPSKLLNEWGVDPIKRNDLVKEHYGFDFALAASKVDTLRRALATSKKGKKENDKVVSGVKGFRRTVILEAPKMLKDLDEKLHKAIERYYGITAVETEFHYPAIAEIIKGAGAGIRHDLSDRITAARNNALGLAA